MLPSYLYGSVKTVVQEEEEEAGEEEGEEAELIVASVYDCGGDANLLSSFTFFHVTTPLSPFSLHSKFSLFLLAISLFCHLIVHFTSFFLLFHPSFLFPLRSI